MFPRNTITGANTFNISLNIFLKVLFYPSETQKLSVWSKKSPGVWYWYINHTPLSVPGIHGQFKQGYVLKNWVEGLSDEAFYPWESPKRIWLKSVNPTFAPKQKFSNICSLQDAPKSRPFSVSAIYVDFFLWLPVERFIR